MDNGPTYLILGQLALTLAPQKSKLRAYLKSAVSETCVGRKPSFHLANLRMCAMSGKSVLEIATSGLSKIPNDWMRATGVRSLIFEDPVLLWLEYHGPQHGFTKDTSPYEFTEFIFGKGRQFERKWIMEMAGEAVRVCMEPFEVRSVEKFRETLDLMDRSVPLIAGPALWWAPERVYGVPDLLVHSTWLRKHFPQVATVSGDPEHYVVFDMKFTTELDSTKKKKHHANYGAQVRIYSYILGQLQRVMPRSAYLVCRDRIADPLDVRIRSSVGAALDYDLATIRDEYLDIKINGANYLPWAHEKVQVNLSNDQDAPWHTAKVEIACNRVPGGDACLVYQIGRKQKEDLARRGFGSLQSLLAPDPDALSLESCHGLGAKTSPRIRAVLSANRSKQVTPASISHVPKRRRFEFFVDFETFNNLNVDFDRQWPDLDGCEMIFMIGVGWEADGEWNFRTFTAEEESQVHEYAMLEQVEGFLRDKTGGRLTDPNLTMFCHWTRAEVWQLRRAADRHGLAPGHTLRKLPWYDLQKEVFLKQPIGVPGAWSYELKDVASALGVVEWPGNLGDGLRATVAGWKAYKTISPSNSTEMRTVAQYNEVDCKALYEIVRWLRGLGPTQIANQ